MDAKDLIEGEDFIEEKDVKEEPKVQISKEDEEILGGPIRKEEIPDAAEINEDDFTADFPKPAPEQKPEPEKPAKVPQQNTSDIEAKNKAIARLVKPEIILRTWNVVGGRIGRMVNKKNPDCLKFNQEDCEDLGTLIKNTAEEENWSRFPTKYILLFIAAIILVGKIIMWNKPAAKLEATNTTNNNLSPSLEKYDRMFEQMNKTIDAMQDQQRMMLEILSKINTEMPTTDHLGRPIRIYKGYDMEVISFSENGALIDPSKAGTKGWSDKGGKHGAISEQDRDIRRHWKQYHEIMHNQAA